jgi:hypothetical protein
MDFRKIGNILGRIPTPQLIMGIFSIGLAALFLQSLFPLEAGSTNTFQSVLINIAFFFFGLSGTPIIVRKEIPGIFHIHGFLAVIVGVFILLTFWTIILYGILSCYFGFQF